MPTYNFRTDFGAVGDGVTDDAAAYCRAGNAMALTTANTLIVPAGNYLMSSNANVSGRVARIWTYGIPDFTMVGDDPATTTLNLGSVCNQMAGQGQPQNSSGHAHVATATKGQSTLTLITPAQTSLFLVNQWVVISCVNIQDIYDAAYGYPSNWQVFEYAQIQSIGVGTLTLTAPLGYSYYSTYPNLNDGSAFEAAAGGSATVYALTPNWDCVVEYQNLSITRTVNAQLYNNGRSVIYRNCTFPTASTPIPTQNRFWGVYNCTATSGDMEVDKGITTMVMDGCTWAKVAFQSSSVQDATINNCTITNFQGTGIRTKISNCTIGTFKPGALAYGMSEETDITDTQITTWQVGGNTVKMSNVGEMTGGVFSTTTGTTPSNMADNGAGKVRVTCASTAGYVVGKYYAIGSPVQELTLNGTTTVGAFVINVPSVPAWIIAGQAVLGLDNNYPAFQNGTTVASVTSTTITLSKSVLSTINSGAKIAFPSADLQAGPFPTALCLAIPGGTTIDFDLNFPSGFVYSFGGNMQVSSINWAIPGKYVYWNGTSGASGTFKVLDIYRDANKTYVVTDQSSFPTIPVDSNGVQAQTSGAQRIRASGLTGASYLNEQLNYSKAYNKPIYSYYKKAGWTGSDSASVSSISPVIVGNLTAIRITVITPYSGTEPTLFFHLTQFDSICRFLADGVQVSLGIAVNAKIAGQRVILPSNTAANPTAQSGDKILVPSWTTSLWMPPNFTTTLTLQSAASQSTTKDISGESSGVWPVIDLEIETDQGFTVIPNAVAPLRLRLRAA